MGGSIFLLKGAFYQDKAMCQVRSMPQEAPLYIYITAEEDKVKVGAFNGDTPITAFHFDVHMSSKPLSLLFQSRYTV